MPQPLTPKSRLQRDLPYLRIDGTIKFALVLGKARKCRELRREGNHRISTIPGASCRLLSRLDQVRSDMARVRTDIANDRAFWSVDNVSTIAMHEVRREYFGHVWAELVPTPAEPVAADVTVELQVAA